MATYATLSLVALLASSVCSAGPIPDHRTNMTNADGAVRQQRVSSGAHVFENNTLDWVTEILNDPKNRLASSAFYANAIDSVLESPLAILQDTHTFNLALPREGNPVTNQRASGRCWIYAATNVLRISVMHKYNLKEFEFSQAHLFFWDKIEKANYFYENVLTLTKEEIDGRLMNKVLSDPLGDGGQWDYVANLVAKYGLVPQSLYPDRMNARKSSDLTKLLTTKVREDALTLRAAAAANSSIDVMRQQKDKMLQAVVQIVTLTLGPPPPSDVLFHWEVYDKDKKLLTIQQTPTQFAASLNDTGSCTNCGGTDVQSLFSLVNDPRNTYMTLLVVDRLGSVWEGRPTTYVNVDMTTLKNAAIAMIRKGIPMFLGSDVGKYLVSTKGILDPAAIDYESAFNIKLGMNKSQRLVTGESWMGHAMTITGVHLDSSGKPIRWRVENSWGYEAGSGGYLVASDAWMDEFCYEIVVHPSAVSKEVVDVLKQKPKHLPLWDPLGLLAM